MVLSVRQLRPHACVWPLQPAPRCLNRHARARLFVTLSVTGWQQCLGSCAPVVFCFGTEPLMCIIVLLCHFAEHRRHLRLLVWLSPFANQRKDAFRSLQCCKSVWPFVSVRVLCALCSGRKTNRSAVVLLTMFLSQPAAASTQCLRSVAILKFFLADSTQFCIFKHLLLITRKFGMCSFHEGGSKSRNCPTLRSFQ